MKKTIRMIVGRIALPALAAAILFVPLAAHASFIVTIQQQGADVVATGQGSIDTASLLSGGGTGSPFPQVYPAGATIVLGTQGQTDDRWITGTLTGPSGFGTGDALASFHGTTGPLIGFLGYIQALYLPQDYVSGNALSATASWNNTNYAALGLAPGNYTWTWANNNTSDSFEIDVQAVPLPNTLALLGGGFLFLLGHGIVRRRMVHA